MHRNIELVLAYDGKPFCGWQIQPNGRTVQGVLNRALETLLNHPVKTLGSSRTDSGVHAHDQHVSFVSSNPIPLAQLGRALNHHLPEDVRLLAVHERGQRFSARHSARAKHYSYVIFNGVNRNPFSGSLAWTIERRLDATVMDRAAEVFTGTNDFSALKAAADIRPDPTVHIYDARVERQGDWVFFQVLGHRFLYNMVRNMLGALVKVGSGEWDPEILREKLRSGDRTQMGMTAPAHGLHLVKVYFEEPIHFKPNDHLERILGVR